MSHPSYLKGSDAEMLGALISFSLLGFLGFYNLFGLSRTKRKKKFSHLIELNSLKTFLNLFRLVVALGGCFHKFD